MFFQSISMQPETACMLERERRPNAIYITYLTECKQILFDFLTMRVVPLPSEPKLHHPEAESEKYHSPRRLRLIEIPLGVNRCKETMWSFMQAPVSFVSTPQAVQVFSSVFMQFDHRANSQEPRLERANQNARICDQFTKPRPPPACVWKTRIRIPLD